MVFITFKPQHTESSEGGGGGREEEKKNWIALLSRVKEHEMNWSSWDFLHYHDKYGEMGRWERERERKGRDSALEREGEGETHDDRQKRADQTERPNCVKKKKKSAQFVLDCKLRAERRNKIRHLAGDHVKPCKWTSPQRRVFPLSLMMDLIASISVKI